MSRETELMVIGQAFDCIQYLIQKKPVDIITNADHQSRALSSFYDYCQLKAINPIYALCACFSRFVYLKRRLKYTPVMMPGYLSAEMVNKSVQASQHYQQHLLDQHVQHVPYLITLNLIASKLWFDQQPGIKQLADKAQQDIKTFTTHEFFKPAQEQLREKVIHESAFQKNPWYYLCLFNGAYSYSPLYFLCLQSPTKAFQVNDQDELELVLKGSFNPEADQLIYQDDFNTLKYLLRSNQAIQKEV